MLNKIRIVLVNTSHPGNIGSVARAMKTMGLSQLYLVAPLAFPHAKALEMASGASDILAQARIVPTLDQAMADCVFVVGTSARTRSIPWPLLKPKELSKTILAHYLQQSVAIIFGREQSGLTNDELEQCHCHVQIPANPIYSSLNLAQAVQIIAYELFSAVSEAATLINPDRDYPLATAEQMRLFYEHLQSVLIELSFLKVTAPRKLMTRLRRFFSRAQPDVMELNIFRGILTAMQNVMKDNNGTL